MRVLLLSPLRGLDPANGDVTYTEQLLANPPPGVRYTTYSEALANGELRELYRRVPGRGPAKTLTENGHPLTFLREALVNRARRHGLLFREPFRHFEVSVDSFDVVHSHVYSVGLGERLPLVVSNSVQISDLYSDAFGMSSRRVRRLRQRDTFLAQRTGVTHSSFALSGAARVICFSEHLRERFLQERIAVPEKLAVVPPGIAAGAVLRRDVSERFTVGFIGDWQAKGGDIALESYRRLHATGTPARMIVVGGPPRLDAQTSARLGITWLPRVPQDELLEELIPSFSAFLYPSRFDGLPLTLLEVMRAGVPPIVSDYGALPEVVDHGRAGLVATAGDAAAFAGCLQQLLQPAARRRYGAAARQRVLDRYTAERTAPALAAVYGEAIHARTV